VRERLWDVRVCLATSALAKRVLFGGLRNYANFSAYRLDVRNFNESNPTVYALNTRLRDGSGVHYWKSDAFTVGMPLQVQDCNLNACLDIPLLDALLKTSDQGILDSARSYCEANTDSEDVAPHLEMLKLMIAFEGLLKCKTKHREFVRAISKAFSKVILRDYDGPLKDRWRERWFSPRPASNVLEAWAYDFHLVRGAKSHAGGEAPSVLAEHQHLAMGDLVFHLLLKIRLHDAGLYTLRPDELARMEHIMGYLVHDPFDPDRESRAAGDHPWSQLNWKSRARSFQPKPMCNEDL